MIFFVFMCLYCFPMLICSCLCFILVFVSCVLRTDLFVLSFSCLLVVFILVFGVFRICVSIYCSPPYRVGVVRFLSAASLPPSLLPPFLLLRRRRYWRRSNPHGSSRGPVDKLIFVGDYHWKPQCLNFITVNVERSTNATSLAK